MLCQPCTVAIGVLDEVRSSSVDLPSESAEAGVGKKFNYGAD